MESNVGTCHHEAWNKGKIVGQKTPFKLRDGPASRRCRSFDDRAPARTRVGRDDANLPLNLLRNNGCFGAPRKSAINPQRSYELPVQCCIPSSANPRRFAPTPLHEG
jgi:hypothetical protein